MTPDCPGSDDLPAGLRSRAVADPRRIWDARYADHKRHTDKLGPDPWLERWRDLLTSATGMPVLDLGCGTGRDSRYLAELGCDVVAADFSEQALRLCREAAPRARHCRVDIREPLPFDSGHFQVVVASLCLHYFPWDVTQRIVGQIHRCLWAGGFLLARLNSTRDVNYGATGHPQVEPGLFLVDGELKRFFDRPAVERLFAVGWAVRAIEERTIVRQANKVLWEVVLEKILRGSSDGKGHVFGEGT